MSRVRVAYEVSCPHRGDVRVPSAREVAQIEERRKAECCAGGEPPRLFVVQRRGGRWTRTHEYRPPTPDPEAQVPWADGKWLPIAEDAQ